MTIGIAPIVTLSRGLVRGYCVLGLSSIGLGISGGEGKCGVLIVKNYPAPKDDAFIATTVRWSARRISAGGVICFCMSRDRLRLRCPGDSLRGSASHRTTLRGLKMHNRFTGPTSFSE